MPRLIGDFQNFGLDTPMAQPLEGLEQKNVILFYFPHVPLKRETSLTSVAVSVFGKGVTSSWMVTTLAPNVQSVARLNSSYSSLGRRRCHVPTARVTHLKRTSHCFFLVSSQSCATITTTEFTHCRHPEKKPCPWTSPPRLALPSRAPWNPGDHASTLRACASQTLQINEVTR